MTRARSAVLFLVFGACGYTFEAEVVFTDELRVSFEGDRLDCGDEVSRSYYTFEDAGADVLIFDVEWAAGTTNVGLEPGLVPRRSDAGPPEIPSYCHFTFQIRLDAAGTVQYETTSRDCNYPDDR